MKLSIVAILLIGASCKTTETKNTSDVTRYKNQAKSVELENQNTSVLPEQRFVKVAFNPKFSELVGSPLEEVVPLGQQRPNDFFNNNFCAYIDLADPLAEQHVYPIKMLEGNGCNNLVQDIWPFLATDPSSQKEAKEVASRDYKLFLGHAIPRIVEVKDRKFENLYDSISNEYGLTSSYQQYYFLWIQFNLPSYGYPTFPAGLIGVQTTGDGKKSGWAPLEVESRNRVELISLCNGYFEHVCEFRLEQTPTKWVPRNFKLSLKSNKDKIETIDLNGEGRYQLKKRNRIGDLFFRTEFYETNYKWRFKGFNRVDDNNYIIKAIQATERRR